MLNHLELQVITVPTKTAHALTRLILLVDLTRIKAYQIVYQTWYIFFILVLGKGLTDISTMPTPKHVVFLRAKYTNR